MMVWMVVWKVIWMVIWAVDSDMDCCVDHGMLGGMGSEESYGHMKGVH